MITNAFSLPSQELFFCFLVGRATVPRARPHGVAVVFVDRVRVSVMGRIRVGNNAAVLIRFKGGDEGIGVLYLYIRMFDYEAGEVWPIPSDAAPCDVMVLFRALSPRCAIRPALAPIQW